MENPQVSEFLDQLRDDIRNIDQIQQQIDREIAKKQRLLKENEQTLAEQK